MRALEPGDPTRIGRYRLLGVVGTGGMGKVYLGRSETGRTVAVKVIRPDLANDDNFRTRFGQEVSSARRVSGGFTAAVLDADLTAPQPWLATAFVSGLSLTEAVNKFGRLPDGSLTVLADGLAKALQAVHVAGVIHRDLKPSNVMLGLDGPRVIDFGIARAADDSVLTASGQLIGSPSYMSPEQVTGKKVGPATDIFAFGGVIVFASRGLGPFGEGDTMTLLWRVVQEEPDISKVPYRLRSIVAACLQKDPAKRPTSDELVGMLEALGPSSSSGWLPPAILEDVSRRTANMLDLEHPLEPDENTATVASPPPTKIDSSTGTVASPTKFVAADEKPAVPAQLHTPAKRSPMLAALVLVSIIAIASLVAAVWLATRGGSEGDAGSGDEVTTGADADGGVLPATFDGQWKGTAAGSEGEYTVEVSLYSGAVGDTVGTSSYTRPNGETCVRDEELTAVDGRTAQLKSRLKDGPASCLDDGDTASITLEGGSTINFTVYVPAGEVTGTLQRQT